MFWQQSDFSLLASQKKFRLLLRLILQRPLLPLASWMLTSPMLLLLQVLN